MQKLAANGEFFYVKQLRFTVGWDEFSNSKRTTYVCLLPEFFITRIRETEFKGYLRYETNVYHKVALNMQLKNLFIWIKNNISFSRLLCFWEIHWFQNLLRHHKHSFIMEIILMLLMNPKYYENEIWSNTSVLCDKHFWHIFGSMLETGN